MPRKKPKALVLFSGGLDSILAIKLLQDQGVAVEAIHFSCPFYSSEPAKKHAKKLGVRIRDIPVDHHYFGMVADPKNGYGSQMNPCKDCKIHFLRKAEKIRKAEGFDFLATGEVVGERPMSQTRPSLRQIENQAGLSRKVVRPLSGRILPETLAERKGLISREKMEAIHGRSRKLQFRLARKFKVKDFPAPAGGCLLTDPEYARRLKEHLRMEGKVTWKQGELMKVGRHFRVGKFRVVVGRHEKENQVIMELARDMKLMRMEVLEIPGPLTVVAGKGHVPSKVVEKAAQLTVKYSDAEGPAMVEVLKGRVRKVLEARPVGKAEAKRLMI